MLSTPLSRVLFFRGKACVKNVGSRRTNWGQKIPVFHNPSTTHKQLWINGPLTHTLYTFCMRVLDSLWFNSTSVNLRFYTVYTALTNTTTTLNIYKRGTQ